jgi:hypothetical protein
MRIVYLTTSLRDEDYNDVFASRGSKPNPASQNFHSRLIEALRQNDAVDVISLLPPFVANIPMNQNRYHYLASPKSRIAKLLITPYKLRQIASSLSFSEGKTIVLYDSLNMTLSHASIAIAALLNAKRIAVVTDKPENITGTSKRYIKLIYRYSKDADGYLALTPSLAAAYNVEGKPSLVSPGIAAKVKNFRPASTLGNYIYFGGALYEKYGVLDLLNAYLSASPNCKLIIAGHGPCEDNIKAALGKNNGIRYLGQISQDDNLTMEFGAALNVNPRPFSRELDLNSIPSKLIEYVLSGKPVLSTPNTIMRNLFPLDVNWLESSGEKALGDFFAAHLDAKGNLINLLLNNGREKALELFSQESVGERIHVFLSSLN